MCQSDRVGGRLIRYRDPSYPYTNVWWARTLSDTGAWGWTSEVYFTGGGNDEPDARLRRCSAAEAGVTGNPGAAPAPSAPPAAPAPARLPLVLANGRPCQGGTLRTGQRVSVHYRLRDRYLELTSNFSMGAPVIRDISNRSGWIGYLSVKAQTCRTAQGWRILPDADVQTASEGLDGVGRPRGAAPGKGWGLYASGALNGTIAVAASRCYANGSPWKALKLALGLPYKTTRYSPSLAPLAGGEPHPGPPGEAELPRPRRDDPAAGRRPPRAHHREGHGARSRLAAAGPFDVLEHVHRHAVRHPRAQHRAGAVKAARLARTMASPQTLTTPQRLAAIREQMSLLSDYL